MELGGGIDTEGGTTGGSGFSETEAFRGYRVLGEANVQREPGEDVVVVLTDGPAAQQDPGFRAAPAPLARAHRSFATLCDNPGPGPIHER